MKSSTGNLRRRIDSVLKTEISEVSAVFGGWAAQGIVEELESSVFPAGKRLRPVLCCLGYAAAGGRISQKILKVSASLELLHTFALIHDDIMDASPSRRGRPSAFKRASRRFPQGRGLNEPERRGVSVAVLAGDLALVLSDRLFTGSGFPPAVLAESWPRLSQMRLQAVAGQYLDLTMRGGPPGDEGLAARIAALKTSGYSVEGPLLVGARLAGAPAGTVKALSGFGRELGSAFQLADDLAGLLGDPLETGKDAEADARRGSPTWLIAKTMTLASPGERAFLEKAWGNPGSSARDLARVRRVVVNSGAAAAAITEIDDHLSRAAAFISAPSGRLASAASAQLAQLASSIGKAAADIVG